MLYKLWEMIQLWLPYGLLIKLYEGKKAIPANIQTRSGKILKAIMITPKHGILYTSQEYIATRGKVLKQQQDLINQANEQLTKEINSLSFVAREELFAKRGEDE